MWFDHQRHLPGFGESARSEKGYFITDFAEFLTGFIETLKLDRPALAGHSLGARVCLDTAGQPGSNVSKLILIDVSPAARAGEIRIGLQLQAYIQYPLRLRGSYIKV